jgi:glycosyltransferase involved in cell wall biosynthesis
VLHFADIINRDDFIHGILAHCDTSRFDMRAATLSDRGSFNSEPGGIPLHHLAAPLRSQALRAASRLRSTLRRHHVDIIHSHHYWPTLIALAATRGLPVTLVIGRHYSDAIYTLASGPRRHLYLALEAVCNASAASIVAPSTAVVRVLRAQGVPEAKIARIPYGFAFDRFELRPPEPETASLWGPSPGWRLATFARLHREKGHAHMAQALELLTREGIHATWVIAGDGPERSCLEALVRRLRITDRVLFVGWRRDVMELMRAADVVVQPTLHEAFSQVMIEAMALGRPLVITDVSGVADVVEHGQTGMIVPPANALALARAIRLVLEGDLHARLGANAARAVRARFDIESIARRMEELYLAVHAG